MEGVCDMNRITRRSMGATDVEGFYLNAGWGTWGFKAIPIAGVMMAELVATGEVPAAYSSLRAHPLSRG